MSGALPQVYLVCHGETAWTISRQHTGRSDTRNAGLLPPNHYLAVAIDYLYRHRPRWPGQAAVGKPFVCSQTIDRVAAKLGPGLYEAPVGFKWFVDGLLDASLGFAGEESAGACCPRLDGRVWTTDKDGIVLALLVAEIIMRMGRDPGEIYRALDPGVWRARGAAGPVRGYAETEETAGAAFSPAVPPH